MIKSSLKKLGRKFSRHPGYRKLRLKYRRWERLWHKKFRYHPLALPIAVFVCIFAISLFLFVLINSHTVGASDAHYVILTHDQKKETLPTRSHTVGEFLQHAGVTINEGDVVEPSQDTSIVEDNFRVNVYRAVPVVVFDGGHRTFALSAASTPRSVAAQAGIDVFPEDNLTIQPTDNFVRDQTIGTQIIIDRATPANLNLYGTQIALRTHAKTVGDLLKEKNVQLAHDDSVLPKVDTPLTPQTQVFVARNGTKLETVEQVIPMPSQTIEDATLSFGTTAERQKGAPGKKLVTYQIDLKNGVEIGRHVIQEVVSQAPVTQIIARGKAISIPDDKTSLMAAAGIAASDYPYVNYIISRESGWCATKWQGQIGYCPAYYTQLHDPSAGYGYGLCQSTPAGKMASAGADWATNPVTQLRWCAGYAQGRYGSWAAAYNHWVAYSNW